MNIKLTLAYDGTSYLGWQKTPMGQSIEESLEMALKTYLQHDIVLQAASRTDAGVHARGQVVNFTTPKNPELNRLLHRVNSLLSADITVLKAEEADPAFHPTLDCVGKVYHYELCNTHAQLPINRFYSWHVPYALDLNKMGEACALLEGKHDFSAFCNAKKNEQYQNTVRELTKIDLLVPASGRLKFVLKGANFLYKMVRNLVGTIVYAGLGKIPIENLENILTSKDRTRAGITAPAHGLTLAAVYYQ